MSAPFYFLLPNYTQPPAERSGRLHQNKLDQVRECKNSWFRFYRR